MPEQMQFGRHGINHGVTYGEDERRKRLIFLSAEVGGGGTDPGDLLDSLSNDLLDSLGNVLTDSRG